MSIEESSIPQNPHTSSSAVDGHDELQEQIGAFQRIELNSDGHDTEQNEEPENQEEFQTNKRKKTSSVWDDFEVVELDGNKKARCTHCQLQFALTKSGTTSSFKRHQQKCVKRKIKLKVTI